MSGVAAVATCGHAYDLVGNRVVSYGLHHTVSGALIVVFR